MRPTYQPLQPMGVGVKRPYEQLNGVPYYLDPRQAQGGFAPPPGIPPYARPGNSPWPPHGAPLPGHPIPQLVPYPQGAVPSYRGRGGFPVPMRGRGRRGGGGSRGGGGGWQGAAGFQSHQGGRRGDNGSGRGKGRGRGRVRGGGSSNGRQGVESFFKESFLDPNPWRHLWQQPRASGTNEPTSSKFKVAYRLPSQPGDAPFGVPSSSSTSSPGDPASESSSSTASEQQMTIAEAEGRSEADAVPVLASATPKQTESSVEEDGNAKAQNETAPKPEDATAAQSGDLYNLFQSFR